MEVVAGLLRRGMTAVVPTDTVYGVAALPSVTGATDGLFALKDRSRRHPLAVLVADAQQALGLLAEVGADVRRWMERLWPGPLTIVGRRSEAAMALELGGDPTTIGVRCPDHAFLRALAASVGPVATTSANRTGEPTPTTALDAAAALATTVGAVVDGGPSGTTPSTVVDTTSEPWRLLRLGAVAEQDLRS